MEKIEDGSLRLRAYDVGDPTANDGGGAGAGFRGMVVRACRAWLPLASWLRCRDAVPAGAR
jgi:hypothetical protein